MKLGADVATALGERVMGAQINAAGVCMLYGKLKQNTLLKIHHQNCPYSLLICFVTPKSHRYLTEIQLSQEVTDSAVWSFYRKRHYSSSENDLAFWPHDSKHKNVNFIYIRKGYLHSDKFSWYVWKWNQNESLDFCEKSVRYLWDICEISESRSRWGGCT